MGAGEGGPRLVQSGIIGATVARGSAGGDGVKGELEFCGRNRRVGYQGEIGARAGAVGRLPRPAQVIAYDRGEPLLYSGIVIYITTSASLAIALLMS